MEPAFAPNGPDSKQPRHAHRAPGTRPCAQGEGRTFFRIQGVLPSPCSEGLSGVQKLGRVKGKPASAKKGWASTEEMVASASPPCDSVR